MSIRKSLVAALFAALAVSAHGADTPGFSFDYTISGDRGIAPYQVFDDGSNTYLQFRDPSRVPTIFVKDAGGSRLVMAQPQGQYLVLPGLTERLEFLSDDRKTASVISTIRKAASVARAPIVTSPAPAAQRPVQMAAAPPDPPGSVRVVPVKPIQQTPPPLYARRAAEQPPQEAAPQAPVPQVPVPQARPANAPAIGDTASLRTELEYLKRMLELVTERLEQATTPGSNYAPVNYERPLNVKADTPQRPASVRMAAAVATAGNGAGYPADTAVPARAVATALPVPSAPAAASPRLYSFKVDAGQRLSDAVRQFVGAQGLELDWDTGGADYEIRFGYVITGGTVEEALFGALSPFKLNAHTRRGNNVVAVTRAS